MKRPASYYTLRAVPVVVLVALSFVLYFISPEELVSLVGIQNAYAFMFALAFFGGFAIFGTIPYHAILVTLAAGGLEPLALGSAAAFGVMLGDTTSYFIGWQGGAILPEGARGFFRRWYGLIEKYPKALPVLCFLYGALVPFSNDFITLSAGLAHYSYKRVMVPLAAGNLVFNISLAYFSTAIYGFFQAA